jgi:hypothetical protein
LEGVTSDTVSVESGVPQVTVLCPSLFLFYINDISEDVNAVVRLFADDTLAYLAITNKSDCSTLQADFHKLAAWENKWKMSFHQTNAKSSPSPRKETPSPTIKLFIVIL